MTYRTILVNLEAGRSNTHLLAAARQVAERFEAGVIGITSCSPIQPVYGDGSAFGDILEQDSQEIEREVAVAEAEFRDAFGQTRFLGWHSAVLMTSLSNYIAQEASRADLILTQAGSADGFNGARQIDLGEFILQAGRPVLVVPSEAVPFRMERVMIGWKNTREARRAVTDALPLLKRASHVDLVEIAPENELSAALTRLDHLAAWLARHGVASEVHASPADKNDSARISFLAAQREADIIVAGAYGHSRMREWVLGGVTRTLLRNPSRPSLLSH